MKKCIAVCAAIIMSTTSTAWGMESQWSINGVMKAQNANTSVNRNPYNIAKVQGVGEGNTIKLLSADGEIQIPLSAPLYQLSSAYYDTLCQKDGVWGIERRIGIMKFDGSEDWKLVESPAYRNNNTTIFQCSSKKDALLWDGVSTHFDVFHKSEQRKNRYDGISFGQDLSQIYMRIMNVRQVKTVEQLKQYLKAQYDAGNPVTFYYILSDKKWEPFDETIQQKLNSANWESIGFFDKNIEKLSKKSSIVESDIFGKKEMKNDVMRKFLSSVVGVRIYGSEASEEFYVEGIYPKTGSMEIVIKSTKGEALYGDISFEGYSYLSSKPIDILLQPKVEAKHFIRMQLDLSKIEVPQEPVGGFTEKDTKIPSRYNVKEELVVPESIPEVEGMELSYYWQNAVLYGDSKMDAQSWKDAAEKIKWISVKKDAGEGKEKKVLLLGDSLVNQDKYPQYLAELFSKDKLNVKLLGTRGEEFAKHEGRGGWSAYDYCNVTSKYGFTNPFLKNGKFDFAYYMKQNDWDNVDTVVIQLGINDLNLVGHNSHEEIFGYYNDIIESIHKYDKNIQILLNEPPLLFEQETTQYAKDTRLAFIKDMQKQYGNREAEGIFLVPLYLTVDSAMGYQWAEQDINELSQNHKLIVTDTTHPNNKGYQSIANMTYAYIKYVVSLDK
ncbi:MAG: SGNH/GDSL hydrolase family protein [Epulopiscium sp.]|jgi:lysophospholipase L1-like esterase|nr:SGNH/GDSL hydrolase family protein [Candidatus Epulonipiscium sp.]